MRLALALLPLLLPASALAEGSSPTPGSFRLGVEVGAAWFGDLPEQNAGPATSLRARIQIADRLALQAGVLLSRQSLSNGSFTSALLPAAFEIRLDRGPVVPYLALGWTVARLSLLPGTFNGPTAGVGIEALLGPSWALTAQATYFGLNVPNAGFPFTSSLTAGLEFCF